MLCMCVCVCTRLFTFMWRPLCACVNVLVVCMWVCMCISGAHSSSSTEVPNRGVPLVVIKSSDMQGHLSLLFSFEFKLGFGNTGGMQCCKCVCVWTEMFHISEGSTLKKGATDLKSKMVVDSETRVSLWLGIQRRGSSQGETQCLIQGRPGHRLDDQNEKKSPKGFVFSHPTAVEPMMGRPVGTSRDPRSYKKWIQKRHSKSLEEKGREKYDEKRDKHC